MITELEECNSADEVLCQWPECKCKRYSRIPVVVDNPRPDEPPNHLMDFCKYHLLIVGGGHFVANKQPNNTFLVGPFGQVSVIESVMAAREMTKQDQPRTMEEVQDWQKQRRKQKEQK